LFHNSNLFGSCIIHILYTECAKIKKNNSGAKSLISLLTTLSLARRLVAGLPLRRPGFDSISVQVRFVLDKVALRQVFFPRASVFPCQYHATSAPDPSSSTSRSYVKEKWVKQEPS